MCFASSRLLAIFQFDMPTCFDSGWMLGLDLQIREPPGAPSILAPQGPLWLDLLNQWVCGLSRSSSRRNDFTDIWH
jgi:hypothetical protein